MTQEPVPVLVGLDAASVRVIGDALARREPIGLVDARLPAGERAALEQRLRAAPVPDDTAAVVFTSGSTGRPKGVVLSHAAIAAAAATDEHNLGGRADDRWLLALSPAHTGGLGIIARCVLGGLPLAIAGGGGRDAVAAALATGSPTLVSLVPAQLAGLLDDPAWRPPPSLRAVLLGGARANEALVEQARRRAVPVMTTYGMSETFGQVATMPLGERGPAGAVGRMLDGVRVEAGTRARPGVIRVHTPAAFSGYLDEPRPDDGAVVTSDLGFVEDGWLFVVGRADDVIVTGGAKVHPLAVEETLAKVPGVRAVCVVGVADERWGERVAAAIVPGGDFDRATLDAAIAAMASHARPREVVFLDELPLGPTGKPDRRALQKRWECTPR